MPPQVHNGAIRGQNLLEYPSVQRFCACLQCADYWTIDRGSNLPVRGQYLGNQEWKKHRSKTLKIGIASDRLRRTPDTPLISPSLFNPPTHLLPPKNARASPPTHPIFRTVSRATPQSAQPTSTPDVGLPYTPVSLQSKPTSESASNPQPTAIPDTGPTSTSTPHSMPTSEPTSIIPNAQPAPTPDTGPSSTSDHPQSTPTSEPARKIPKKATSHSSPFDFFKAKLKEIQIALKNSHIEDLPKLIAKDPLIFIHTPTQTTITPLSYDLDGQVARNSTVIGHEEWLVHTVQFISVNLKKERQDTHARLLAKTLVTQAEKDLRYLRKEKTKEWHRQRASIENEYLDTCA